MGKVHNITSLIAVLFISVMIFLMVQPMNFLNKNLEQFYHLNEGLIWFIGLILGVLIAWRTYANGMYQSELKKCALLNKEKSDQITVQNSEIIKNQKEYIKEIRSLNKQIQENSEKDLKTLSIIQDQGNRITINEKQISKFINVDRRLTSIEKLLKIHDDELQKLKV